MGRSVPDERKLLDGFMKFSADAIYMTISLHEGDAFVNMIPPGGTRCLPHCEVIETTCIPAEILAYIEQLERQGKLKE